MTIMTHTVDAGVLGEVDLTVSYKFRKGHKGTRLDPSEADSATIGWIKIGGYHGVEVELSDDYITDEIIPACVADWHGEAEVQAEANGDRMREELRESLTVRRAA